MKLKITGYLDKLKGESEEQMDVPAFLRHAQLSQRHIPSTCSDFTPQKTSAKSTILQFMDEVVSL